MIVSLSSLFGRVTIKGCDAQDWDLRHSSPLFLEGVLSLISGLNDVCMHVVGYLVVFVFSQKKRESWRTSTTYLLTHCRTLTIDDTTQFGICGHGITETTYLRRLLPDPTRPFPRIPAMSSPFKQRFPFKRTDTSGGGGGGDDGVGVETEKSHSPSKKQDYGITTEIPPKYDGSDVERRMSTSAASIASHNISGIHDNTHRQLKPRHIQLIGIGGTIGTALYVQIGRGLLNGGPASLFIAFTFWYHPPPLSLPPQN